MFRSSHDIRKNYGKDNTVTRALAARDDRRRELERERRAEPHVPQLGWRVPKEFILPIEDISERWRFRHMGNHTSITAIFCGDPSFERSALGGYKQRGFWTGDGPKKGWADL